SRAETQPKLQPALLRLSAMISQYFTRVASRLLFLAEFLEPRIAANRIEHRIEAEQCRSKRSARSKRTRIRCRQKLLQSRDGAIGFSCLHCQPREKLNRSGTSYGIFLDRIHSYSPLR